MMAIASQVPAASAAIIKDYWWLLWLLLFFGFRILGWLAEVLHTGALSVRKALKQHHSRRLDRLRLELEIARAGTLASTPLPAARLGQCAHRHARQVRTRDDRLLMFHL
jgi:hypothetical protein